MQWPATREPFQWRTGCVNIPPRKKFEVWNTSCIVLGSMLWHFSLPSFPCADWSVLSLVLSLDLRLGCVCTSPSCSHRAQTTTLMPLVCGTSEQGGDGSPVGDVEGGQRSFHLKHLFQTDSLPCVVVYGSTTQLVPLCTFDHLKSTKGKLGAVKTRWVEQILFAKRDNILWWQASQGRSKRNSIENRCNDTGPCLYFCNGTLSAVARKDSISGSSTWLKATFRKNQPQQTCWKFSQDSLLPLPGLLSEKVLKRARNTQKCQTMEKWKTI